MGHVRGRARAGGVLRDDRPDPRHRDRGARYRHLGAEVRPSEFPDAFEPSHEVVIPHIDFHGGEMFDLDGPAARCADGGNYDCLLVAAPLRVAGGVGAPVNPIAVR
jgi:hypothetical protein